MLQCDLSYMISPQMFGRFVLPELAASCRRLGNPAYHLDGPGEIPHVDMLLSIPELRAMQYVPTVSARDATRGIRISTAASARAASSSRSTATTPPSAWGWWTCWPSNSGTRAASP